MYSQIDSLGSNPHSLEMGDPGKVNLPSSTITIIKWKEYYYYLLGLS